MKIYKIKRVLRSLSQSKVSGEDGLVQGKSALFEFMERYPVRKVVLPRQIIKAQSRFLQLILKPMPIVVGLLIAALLGGGGVAYASQGSLPGDTLYPVKLMTEDVQTTVAWNPEKKVELESRFANRRLEEIQKLQERLKKKNGEINPEIIERAMERAEKRLEKAEERIAQMEEGKLKDKAMEATSRLEEALEKHQQILSDLADQVPKPAERALLRAQGVAAKHAERALERIMQFEKAKEVGEKVKERVREGTPKILGAEERAKNKLQALKNRLEALEKHLSNFEAKGVTISEEARTKLAEAKNKVSEAESLFNEGKYLESFQAAHEAMKLMLQVQLFSRPGLTSQSISGPGPVDSVSPDSGENSLEPLQQQNQNQYQYQGVR